MPQRIGHGPRLALVGAAGTVGSQIAELIGQRDFTYADLKLFGSANSGVDESDESAALVEELASSSALTDFDIAFLATPGECAAEIVVSRPGPVLIDLSAAKRAPTAAIPLAAPGLTAHEHIATLKKPGVVGVPHPAAQVIASILSALGIRSGFAGATLLIGASGQGREAIAKLFNQSVELLNARLNLEDDEYQTAFNVLLPPTADELGEVIARQVVALAGVAPTINVQVLQVPAFHGAGVALFLPAVAEMPDCAALLRAAPGIILVETGAASSFVDAAGQEAVIAKLTETPAGAMLWCVFDAARLAALTAVWIAETVRL
jgi:aspartate-semialdehyde dehydrogenase